MNEHDYIMARVDFRIQQAAKLVELGMDEYTASEIISDVYWTGWDDGYSKGVTDSQ